MLACHQCHFVPIFKFYDRDHIHIAVKLSVPSLHYIPTPGWEEFFSQIEQFAVSLERYWDRRVTSLSFAEYAVERLQVCVIAVKRLKDYLTSSVAEDGFGTDEVQNVATYCTSLDALIVYLRQQLHRWDVYMDSANISSVSPSSISYSLPLHRVSRVGRPKFEASKDQLEYLHSMMFNWTKIAAMLGVSRTTIYRRRLELGLSSNYQESNVTDQELENIFQVVRRENPNIGQTMTIGKLRSMGIRVSRTRVRSCMRAIDPISMALRWRGQLARRQPYSVPGPNSLWHLGESFSNIPRKHASYILCCSQC